MAINSVDANTKKTIVLAINSLQGGGAERFVLTIGQAFHQLGFDVHVLRFNDKVEYELSDDLHYHLLPYERYRWLPRGRLRPMLFAKKVDKYIRKHIGIPALILSNLDRANETFRYSQLPNIAYVIHNTVSLLYYFADSDNLPELIAKLQNIYGHHPCICVSHGVKADFIKYLGDITPVTAIHNPIDKPQIEQLAEAYVPDYQNYLLHVGSFKFAKRHDILIKAYAKSQQTMPLVLLGQGKLQEDMEALVKQLGLTDKVHFAGFCANPYPWIKHAHCKILSSNREGFALVVAEALALQTPVISTDCQSGPAEMLP